MTERGLRSLLERQVELFNAAVLSGDYDSWLATFDDEAVLRFDDFPLGPFVGRYEIAEATTLRPASDTMALIYMEIVGADAVRADFEWDAGGCGQLYLRFDRAKVVEFAILFRAESSSAR